MYTYIYFNNNFEHFNEHFSELNVDWCHLSLLYTDVVALQTQEDYKFTFYLYFQRDPVILFVHHVYKEGDMERLKKG
jgi:hypothetical protein